MPRIEVLKFPRYEGATDEHCIHSLIYNGIELGTWYGGKDKKYLNPEKWADEQLEKRVKTIHRNIERLDIEINGFKEELRILLK